MSKSQKEITLDIIRNDPGETPTPRQLLMKALEELSTKLDDIKLKIDISNEIGLELLELRKSEARPEFGAPVRRFRNMPPSSRYR